MTTKPRIDLDKPCEGTTKAGRLESAAKWERACLVMGSLPPAEWTKGKSSLPPDKGGKPQPDYVDLPEDNPLRQWWFAPCGEYPTKGLKKRFPWIKVTGVKVWAQRWATKPAPGEPEPVKPVRKPKSKAKPKPAPVERVTLTPAGERYLNAGVLEVIDNVS